MHSEGVSKGLTAGESVLNLMFDIQILAGELKHGPLALVDEHLP